MDSSGAVNSANDSNSFGNAVVKLEKFDSAEGYNESFGNEASSVTHDSSGNSASGNAEFANFNSFGNTVIKCESFNNAITNCNSLDITGTTNLNRFGNGATNTNISVGIASSSEDLDSFINSAADSFGNTGSLILDSPVKLASANVNGFGNVGAFKMSFCNTAATDGNTIGNPAVHHNSLDETGSPMKYSLGNPVSTDFNGSGNVRTFHCSFGNAAASNGNIFGNPGATNLSRSGTSASASNMDKVRDRILAFQTTSTKAWHSSVRTETRNEIVNQM